MAPRLGATASSFVLRASRRSATSRTRYRRGLTILTIRAAVAGVVQIGVSFVLTLAAPEPAMNAPVVVGVTTALHACTDVEHVTQPQ